MITQQRLTQLLEYDAITGIFKWKIKRGRAKPGMPIQTKDKKGYLKVCLDGKKYFLHRLAWLYVNAVYPSAKQDIDHKNNVVDDNSIGNLRIATRSQNCCNTSRKSNNKTGYKGVHFCNTRKKYIAQIMIDGKRRSLGIFDTSVEAYNAYCVAAPVYHKNFHKVI